MRFKVLELCFPLFLYYLKKSQDSSLLMYVTYLSPELQQDVAALLQSSLFSSTQAHVDASPLVSREERERAFTSLTVQPFYLKLIAASSRFPTTAITSYRCFYHHTGISALDLGFIQK